LKKIKHDAFRECRTIQILSLKNCKFRNYRGDLKFLKKLYDLEDLDLSYAFVDEDFTDFSRMYEVLSLSKLDI